MRLSRSILPLVAATLVAGAVAAACGDDDDEAPALYATKKAPQATIQVDLVEFKVTASAPGVASGPTKFVAKNSSASLVHELAVLRIKDDGTYENGGEIEALKPGKGGEIVLDLPKGKYLLACLIAPGEAGSTVDHFKEGMKTEFEVR